MDADIVPREELEQSNDHQTRTQRALFCAEVAIGALIDSGGMVMIDPDFLKDLIYVREELLEILQDKIQLN
jgi:hypothetical protein